MSDIEDLDGLSATNEPASSPPAARGGPGGGTAKARGRAAGGRVTKNTKTNKRQPARTPTAKDIEGISNYIVPNEENDNVWEDPCRGCMPQMVLHPAARCSKDKMSRSVKCTGCQEKKSGASCRCQVIHDSIKPPAHNMMEKAKIWREAVGAPAKKAAMAAWRDAAAVAKRAYLEADEVVRREAAAAALEEQQRQDAIQANAVVQQAMLAQQLANQDGGYDPAPAVYQANVAPSSHHEDLMTRLDQLTSEVREMRKAMDDKFDQVLAQAGVEVVPALGDPDIDSCVEQSEADSDENPMRDLHELADSAGSDDSMHPAM